MRKIIKKHENKIKLFLTITLVLVVLLSNFLSIHYAQDTYCVFNSGYRKYARHFMTIGRPIGAVIMGAFGLLDIPIKGYLFFNSLFSIITLSLSICILFYTLKYLLHIKIKKLQI